MNDEALNKALKDAMIYGSGAIRIEHVPLHAQPLVTLTLPGRPIVKKNTQRVVGSGRFKRRILSPRYLEWESRAMVHALRSTSIALIDSQVSAVFRFYFANRQGEADVSNLIEGPQDLLVKLGVLKDDRLVMHVTGEKFFGHDARTEVEIYKYETTNKEQK